MSKISCLKSAHDIGLNYFPPSACLTPGSLRGRVNAVLIVYL